jgi:hypothetical protein
VLFWAYLALPIQYLWVGIHWYAMFLIWIPVYALLMLPLRMVLIGETRGFLRASFPSSPPASTMQCTARFASTFRISFSTSDTPRHAALIMHSPFIDNAASDSASVSLSGNTTMTGAVSSTTKYRPATNGHFSGRRGASKDSLKRDLRLSVKATGRLRRR